MSTPHHIKVAAAQYPLDAVPSFAAWQAKMAAWVTDGASTGAALLVFPEYAALELAAARRQAGDLQSALASAADMRAEAEAHLCKLAAQCCVHILTPSGPTRDGAEYTNRAALITPAGAIGHQDKLIMTPFERDWGISPGKGLNVFETALGRVGVALCYDSEFPLLVRAMAEVGADIVLIPSCTEQLSGYHRVRTAAAARALESQIATVMSPTVGDASWCPAIDKNTGAAGIFTPPDTELSMTGVLAEGEMNEPGWVAAEIDLAALRRIRDHGEMRNARDWSLQPGAAQLSMLATKVTLT